MIKLICVLLCMQLADADVKAYFSYGVKQAKITLQGKKVQQSNLATQIDACKRPVINRNTFATPSFQTDARGRVVVVAQSKTLVNELVKKLQKDEQDLAVEIKKPELWVIGGMSSVDDAKAGDITIPLVSALEMIGLTNTGEIPIEVVMEPDEVRRLAREYVINGGKGVNPMTAIEEGRAKIRKEKTALKLKFLTEVGERFESSTPLRKVVIRTNERLPTKYTVERPCRIEKVTGREIELYLFPEDELKDITKRMYEQIENGELKF